MATYEFHYASCLESEGRMLDQLEHALAREHVTPETWRPFMLAVSEAFTNALVHGNQSDPSKQVTIRLTVNENMLAADIIDEGTGGLARLKGRKPRGLLAEGGRGIDLIERFVDTVEYVEEPHGGLRVSLSMTRKKQTQALI